MERVRSKAPPIPDETIVDSNMKDAPVGSLRLTWIGPPQDEKTPWELALSQSDGPWNRVETSASSPDPLSVSRKRLNQLKFLLDERTHELEELARGTVPWEYLGGKTHSWFASVTDFAPSEVRLPIAALKNAGDCLIEAERSLAKVDPNKPAKQQRPYRDLEVYVTRTETLLRSYDQQKASYQQRAALGQQIVREAATGVAAGVAGAAVPGIGLSALLAAGAAGATDLTISVYERELNQPRDDQPTEDSLLGQAAQAGIINSVPGYLLGKAARFLYPYARNLLSRPVPVSETTSKHAMHMQAADLPQEVPWYSDHFSQEDWQRSIAYLRWYSFQHFDHELHPVFWQYLDLRAKNPIGALDPRRDAMNASSVVAIVKWWKEWVTDFIQHPPPYFQWMPEAEELQRLTTEALARGKYSIRELDDMANLYLVLRWPGRFEMPFDQRPPPSYGIGHFDPHIASNKNAAGVGSRNFVADETEADNFPHSPFDFALHDIGHDLHSSLYPRVSNAIEYSGVMGQGASFVHDLPRLVRQAHFKNWLNKRLESENHSQAERLRMIYYALTHETGSFSFPHYVTPLPEHLVAGLRGQGRIDTIDTILGIGVRNQTISRAMLDKDIDIFVARCRDYLHDLPDGQTRILNAEFHADLEYFAQDRLAADIVQEVQLRVNSNNPTIQDYLLFLTKDPNFRNTLALRMADSNVSAYRFHREFNALAKFAKNWADKHHIDRTHPSEFFRGVKIQRR